VMFQCPAHLKDRVKEREGKFQAFNRRHFYNILSHTKLRDGVGQEQAMEYFRIFQEMFNGYHRRYLERGEEIEYRAGMHEEKLAGMVEVLLYGIAEKE
ncbi:MAG TPA: hypothetical protein IAB31_12570, partial [Candidatus Choladousia intestinavium]|nr:hypothetical protein [Candidatus Choladousia intestinavium]